MGIDCVLVEWASWDCELLLKRASTFFQTKIKQNNMQPDGFQKKKSYSEPPNEIPRKKLVFARNISLATWTDVTKLHLQ